MTAEAIASIAAAVVALTQLLKWGGIPDKAGPLAVLVLAAMGVALWGYSTEPMWSRNLIFTYFSAWIVVATSSAGVFGFTRAASSAVVAAKAPPAGGAGSDRTVDDPLISTVQETSPPRAGSRAPRMPHVDIPPRGSRG